MSVARWLLFAALVGLVGCVTIRSLMLDIGAMAPPSGRREPPESRLARLGLALSSLAVLSWVALGIGQVAVFRDPFAPLADEVALLFLRTPWGHTWFVGLFTLALSAVAFAFARPREVGANGRASGVWWLATVIVALLGFLPALNGHAVGSDRFRFLAVAADGIHVLSAGAWIGGLGTMLLLFGPRCRGNTDREVLARLLPRFSNLALIAVALLVVTGLFSSWLHVPTFGALWSSTYGRLLLGKLALVALVVGLGAFSLRSWTRRRRSDGAVELPPTALTEWVLAQVVVVVTAVLVATPFPME